MKKSIALVLALVMCFSLVLVGCGSSAPAASGDSAPAGNASAPADNAAAPAGDDGKVYEIRVASWNSEATPSGESQAHAVELMNEKGNGRIKATIYMNETLLASVDHLIGTAQGLADIAYWQVDLVAGSTPMASMLTLPFTQAMPKSQGLTNAVRELILDTPDNPFQAEMAEMGLRWVTVKDPDGMCVHLTADKPVYAIKDLQGLKLLGVAEMQNYVALGGGNIVVNGPADYYTSLEKGVADGTLWHQALVAIFTVNELTKSHTVYGTNTGIHCCTVGWVANLDFWNSLPADIQDIVTECLQWDEDNMIAQDTALVDALTAQYAEEGQAVYTVAEEDMGPWYEAGDTFVKEWIAERQKTSNYDVQQWYDTYMEIATAHMNDE